MCYITVRSSTSLNVQKAFPEKKSVEHIDKKAKTTIITPRDENPCKKHRPTGQLRAETIFLRIAILPPLNSTLRTRDWPYIRPKTPTETPLLETRGFFASTSLWHTALTTWTRPSRSHRRGLPRPPLTILIPRVSPVRVFIVPPRGVVGRCA